MQVHWLAGDLNLGGLAVRLEGGSTPAVGRLEVLRDGQWAFVSAWDIVSRPGIAAVACQSLVGTSGVTSKPEVMDPMTFGISSAGKWLNVSSCSGNEVLVHDCQCGRDIDYYSDYYKCSSESVPLMPGMNHRMAASQLVIACPTFGGAFMQFGTMCAR